jgi:hypothetical protein
VADTRNILSGTRSLKRSLTSTSTAVNTLISVYFDIIEDIEALILERLRNNRFEDPFFVACVTSNFIQGIAEDIYNQSRSHFLEIVTEFQKKNVLSGQQIKTGKLGLRALSDFLINYMSDMEDQVRANAMAKCGQSYLTQNDKSQIVSSMVLAIYPHLKTINLPKNLLGVNIEKILERIIKFGIRYECIKHINRSISICQTLPLGNPCDVIVS